MDTKFSPDELGFIETALTSVLVASASGELDLNRLALVELAARGRDRQGRWVGFDAAKLILAHGSAVGTD
jgi:hypothetical protein